MTSHPYVCKRVRLDGKAKQRGWARLRRTREGERGGRVERAVQAMRRLAMRHCLRRRRQTTVLDRTQALRNNEGGRRGNKREGRGRGEGGEADKRANVRAELPPPSLPGSRTLLARPLAEGTARGRRQRGNRLSTEHGALPHVRRVLRVRHWSSRLAGFNRTPECPRARQALPQARRALHAWLLTGSAASWAAPTSRRPRSRPPQSHRGGPRGGSAGARRSRRCRGRPASAPTRRPG
mmetsp:Transcript_86701/g.232560  ORF Transcript_86701/g.232560 Transcript_86701/m.232560 type:complete len:237 (+) Transcript_86701:165-875(+)